MSVGTSGLSARKICILVVYFLLFWILLPLILSLPCLLFPEWKLPIGLPPRILLSLPFILTGTALMYSAMTGFRRYGRGLPVSHLPPEVLVSGGLYSYCRHPIYTGYCLIWLGIAFLLRSAGLLFISLPALCVGSAFYAAAEERRLMKRYGRSYEQYRRDVSATPFSLKSLAMLLAGPVVRAKFSFKAVTTAALHHAKRSPGISISDRPSRTSTRAYTRTYTRAAGSSTYPTGGCVVIAPHNNYLDPIFVSLAAGRSINFLTTHDMFRSPLMEWVFLRTGAVRVDRYRSNPAAIARIVRIVRNGGCAGIFPEGGRSWFGEGTVQEDLIELLYRYRLPVLPVRLHGTYTAWPRWGSMRSFPVRAEILPLQVPVSRKAVFELISALRSSPDAAKIFHGISKYKDGHEGSPMDAGGLESILYHCASCKAWDSIRTSGGTLRCSACNTSWVLLNSDPLPLLQQSDGTFLRLDRWHAIEAEAARQDPAELPPAVVRWHRETGFRRSDQVFGEAKIFVKADGFHIHCGPDLGGPDLGGPNLTNPEFSAVIPFADIDAVLIRGNSILQIYHRGTDIRGAPERPADIRRVHNCRAHFRGEHHHHLDSFTFSDHHAFAFQETLRLCAFGSVRVRKRGDTVLVYT